MHNRDKTCKERVADALISRYKDIKSLYEAYCEGDEDHEDGCIHDYALSFDYVPSCTFDGQRNGYFRYQISWGGPSDEFRFYVDETYKPYKIEYWYMDWFDGASKKVTGKKFEFLSDFFSEYLSCGEDQEFINSVVAHAVG